MALQAGASAASAELNGSGSVTGFNSSFSSGVMIAAVFCSGIETSSGAFTIGGGGLTWGYISGNLSGTPQSILLFSAPYSSALSSATITVTPHSPVSGHWVLVVFEIGGAQNTFDPATVTSANNNSASLASGNFTTTNANDMLLGLAMDEGGGTDTLVGASGYTAAISTQNGHANTGAAIGIVYKIVSATSSTNNAQATITNANPWVMLGIGIEQATGGASASASGGGQASGSVVASSVASASGAGQASALEVASGVASPSSQGQASASEIASSVITASAGGQASASVTMASLAAGSATGQALGTIIASGAAAATGGGQASATVVASSVVTASGGGGASATARIPVIIVAVLNLNLRLQSKAVNVKLALKKILLKLTDS